MLVLQENWSPKDGVFPCLVLQSQSMRLKVSAKQRRLYSIAKEQRMGRAAHTSPACKRWKVKGQILMNSLGIKSRGKNIHVFFWECAENFLKPGLCFVLLWFFRLLSWWLSTIMVLVGVSFSMESSLSWSSGFFWVQVCCRLGSYQFQTVWSTLGTPDCKYPIILKISRMKTG